MAKNVFEELTSKHQSLVEKLQTNEAVTKTVMGYLNLLTGLAIKTFQTPIEGVAIDDPVIDSSDCFKARVHFHPVAISGPRLIGSTSNFVEYAQAKAQHMAVTLLKNPKLESFFTTMVETIDRWAVSKGMRFEDVDIGGPEYVGQGPIIQRGTNMIMFKLGRKLGG